MALFKQVKKPEIRNAGAGSDVSSHRPAHIEKTAPCIAGCTINNHVRDWIVPLAQHQSYGRTEDEAFAAAWNVITILNPFPAISGRVCQHPCENLCNRKGKEGAVAIRDLERFVGDFAISHQLKLVRQTPAGSGARIAVVGAGPSGLSCAYRLAQRGHSVVLFDAAPLPGGMMRRHISRNVLPLNVLEYEVQNILDLGVEFRGNCVVGSDLSTESLATEFQAVIHAIGLQKPASMAVHRHANGAWLCGEPPAEIPGPVVEATDFQPRTLNMVTPCIAQGGKAAEEIDAALKGGVRQAKPDAAVIKMDRMKLDWYPALERWTPGNDAVATASDITATQAIAEAARCMSCGMCMDCESCWMYCSNNCFVKLPKGEHYKIRHELCNGCNKCAEACPCGFLEMQ
ncbi:MAG: FAD-dependent oxidoreductase [Acidobacteriota bacterium]